MKMTLEETANIVTRLDVWDRHVGHGTTLFKAAKEEIERLRAALRDLIPMTDPQSIEEMQAVDVAKMLVGAYEQTTVKERP